jgi:hypothetical protein
MWPTVLWEKNQYWGGRTCTKRVTPHVGEDESQKFGRLEWGTRAEAWIAAPLLGSNVEKVEYNSTITQLDFMMFLL